MPFSLTEYIQVVFFLRSAVCHCVRQGSLQVDFPLHVAIVTEDPLLSVEVHASDDDCDGLITGYESSAINLRSKSVD
jgi:hypothetical protein